MRLEALFKVSYGMYIVTSHNAEKINGQIANTVFQITAEPPTIAVSINKGNLTHEYIKESGSFLINVLDINTKMTFIGRFGFKSGRDIDKFENIQYRLSQLSNPILEENSIAFIEAEIEKEVDMGTHTVFIGRITDADIVKEEGEPMTYAHYHIGKKGKAPKAAPTYQKE